MALDHRIRTVVASVFGVDPESLSLKDSPETLADWDSVNHIHLVLALEAEFSVQFEPGQLAELRSLSAIQVLLSQRGVVNVG